MKSNSGPAAYFGQKKLTTEERKIKARQKRSLLAWGRFGSIALSILFGYLAIDNHEAWWILPLLGALAVFGRVVIWDVNNNMWIRRLENLDDLVRQEEAFLKTGTPIPGNDTTLYLDPEHPYAYDLDIFGKGSLYALLNRAHSEPGRALLAEWLLERADREQILERQAAVKEIANDPDWIFDLFAIGREAGLQRKTIERILNWLYREEAPFRGRAWKFIRWAYPTVTLSVLALYAAGVIPSAVFSLLFLVFLVTSLALSGMVGKHYTLLSGIVKEISTLSESLKLIEGKSFSSPLNQRLQGALLQPVRGSAQIRGLDKLLSRFDYRLNVFVFIPFLNPFLAWDMQQMIGLNEWRNRNRKGVEQWADTLAWMEALGSIALMHFDRPEWCFPEILPEHFHFSGRDLGHPLIPAAKRVSNSFAADGTGQLELVTGSNMAGKSTFLRTIGINMVLSMAGAPVCAAECKASPISVVSSMRIADNLEDSTSTFYAELKKLRSIIDKVNRHEHVFILLDEILRGTNSRDRLTGSKALIKQLIRDNAVGVIATHDLELAQLTEDLPGHIHNYYFDVQFHGEELSFDYTLKQGVCTTKNAELLMKQIGIQI